MGDYLQAGGTRLKRPVTANVTVYKYYFVAMHHYVAYSKHKQWAFFEDAKDDAAVLRSGTKPSQT